MSQGLNNDMAVSKSGRIVKNLRWWILVLFLLGVTVNYITRNSLGIIAPELKTSLGITTEQYSWIVGAFQLAYTIFQPLCGWLIDVIGLKLGFMICATLWAVACIAHAGAGSWLHLAILRFFMGGAEAAATPANAKTLGEWFPKSERPIAAGWAGVGFSVGAMLAPPIIYFAHASFGWQGAFMFTGALALLWVVLWWAFYHNPEKHPNLGKAELALIQQDNEAPPVKLPFFTALKTVSKNKRFYGIAIPAFMAEPAWAVLSFWVPLYLAKEHGMDLKQIAMFAWLPFLAADLGSVASGYLTKRCGPEELVQAVRSVGMGGHYLCADALRALRGGEQPAQVLEVLTPREREVFDLLVKGDSVKEIAFKLDLSHKTVHVHRANVLGKLQCHSTIELVHFALDHQLLAGH